MTAATTVPPARTVRRSDTCDEFQADAGRIRRARERLVSRETADRLSELFGVLGDSTRVRLIGALAGAELCVCDLATLIGLSESAVSHQLRLLRSLRVVRARRSGRMVLYALADRHILELFDQGRRHVQEG